ncbi:DUF4185 domain-containing protein [Streptomyces sp. 769]|uniref:DUF4185 domain-containing protein n=1 Tax=Streptomyces sp. 769 TaxID=1262452 RepID=UPI000AEBE4BE|nr:DUF4185 domain-containing protein [Streptomyces sp. 769]
MEDRKDNALAGAWHGRPMSRAKFLKTAAGAVIGGGALLGGAGAARAVAGTSGGSAQKQGGTLQVSLVKDLTGPGITDRYGMAATDLGVPAKTPDGRLVFVFGDTWEDEPEGKDWRAPVALYSQTSDLAQGIEWSGAVGGDRAQQLWRYDHNNPEFDTVLPGDVITIDDTMYLHVAVQKPYPSVVWTEIWKSTDSGATWEHTGCMWGKPGQPGLSPHFQMVTWGRGSDHYVYCWSTKFDGSESIIMHRVPEGQITNPTAYEPWTRTGWGTWGDEAAFVLTGKYRELCLRPIDGKWLFTGLDNTGGRIVAHILDVPDGDPGPEYTLISGVSWQEDDPTTGRVAQPYGGYVIPGSTLNDLHITVSQWENPANQVPGPWKYHVMQFRIQGLSG